MREQVIKSKEEIKLTLSTFDGSEGGEGNPDTPPANPDSGGAPATPPSEPFMVFQTKEEFDNHAAGIKTKYEKGTLESLGFSNLSIAEAKGKVDAYKSISDTVGSLEEYNKVVNENAEKDLSIKLLGSNVKASDLKYALIDIKEQGVDVKNEEQFNKFVTESRWTKQTQQNLSTSQAGIIKGKTVDESNLDEKTLARIKMMTGK